MYYIKYLVNYVYYEMNREMEIEKGWNKDGINNILKCQLAN